MKRLVITGAGNLGLALYDHFKTETTYEPILVARHSPASNKINYVTGDITLPDSMARMFHEVTPDAVIHTAALTDVDLCEKEPKRAYTVNVEGTRNLAQLCKGEKIPLIYVSTDYVFDGKKGNYTERDILNPVNVYGKTKLEGENVVKEMKGVEWNIIRTSYLFNYSCTNYDFISYVFHGLTQRKKMKIDDFRIVKPTPCSSLGAPIGRILFNGKRGVYHLTGRDVISPYDLAIKCSLISGYDPGSIAVRGRCGEGVQRPLISTLNTEKAERDLDFTPPELDDYLEAYFKMRYA